MKVYLAGPDVFLSNAVEVGEIKKQICRRFGIEGCFPLDNVTEPAGLSPTELAHRIYQGNVALMRECDLAIANLSPFRGPSADVGTVFEVGFMCALNRPVFGYSNTPGLFFDRVRALIGADASGTADPNGDTIENFDLFDNLMIPCGIESLGGQIVTAPATSAPVLAALEAFEQCARLVAGHATQVKRSVGQPQPLPTSR